ncbi:MAG: tRNA glutamyl-Q(34) synthetase GluQRS [Rhodospirillaceae bacterium]
MSVVCRFAPSPTGHLHLGHAYAALYAWRTAIEAGGRFLLRIEDIDRQRCRPGFERDLIEDLDWLGLTWEQPVRRQSEHFADYRAALARLQELGVVYPCFCSRQDIALAGGAPHGGDADGPLYPGRCRALAAADAAAHIAEGRAYASRLDLGRALTLTGPLDWYDRSAGRQTARPERLGDLVLARRDTPTSYHLSVTLDDALQGVTLVTRGTDLFAATHSHRLLQALLGLPTPDYHHHPLLTGADGQRLAKRNGALPIRALRSAGHSAAAVRAMAGFPDPG